VLFFLAFIGYIDLSIELNQGYTNAKWRIDDISPKEIWFQKDSRHVQESSRSHKLQPCTAASTTKRQQGGTSLKGKMVCTRLHIFRYDGLMNAPLKNKFLVLFLQRIMMRKFCVYPWIHTNIRTDISHHLLQVKFSE